VGACRTFSLTLGLLGARIHVFRAFWRSTFVRRRVGLKAFCPKVWGWGATSVRRRLGFNRFLYFVIQLLCAGARVLRSFTFSL